MMEKVTVLGVRFNPLTQEEFMHQFKQRFAENKGSFVVTANPEIVMYAKAHQDYAHLLRTEADFITADGIGVVKAAAMLNTPLPERVTGYDLMLALLAWANDANLKVALIGAKQAVNELAVAKVHAAYPNVQVVAAHDGYFDLEDRSVYDQVVAAQPDMVFAALGFPKQELFLADLKQALPSAYLMGVGGSFDVLAGVAKRAPKWMQRIHMEWFYRLLKDPKRIGRMAVLPKFLIEVKKSR